MMDDGCTTSFLLSTEERVLQFHGVGIMNCRSRHLDTSLAESDEI
jgi:hypothetical protein